MELDYNRQIYEKSSNIISNENSSSGNRLVPRVRAGERAGERTARRTDMTKLIESLFSILRTRLMACCWYATVEILAR